MPAHPLRTALAALLSLASLATACAAGPPDHVHIGVVAPLSGPRAAIGQEMRNGATLAVEDLNRNGGLLGSPVELVVVDDADLVRLPSQLADLAERTHVTAVIGPEAPGILLGPRSPLTRRDVPAVLPSALAGDLSDAGSLVVRTVPSARDQAEALARWAADVRGMERVAVLLVDVVEGPDARADIEAGLVAGGLELAGIVEGDPEAARLEPAVNELLARAGEVDLLLLWGQPPAAARATLAARSLAPDVQLAVPASGIVAEYRTLAGEASENVVLPFPFRREWFTPELFNWFLRYNREYGIGALSGLETLVLDLPVVAAATYDATLLIADAVTRAGTRVPADVGDELLRGEVDGILREYALVDREAWSVDDLFVARFHRFATVYDADPRLDPDSQRRFWQSQVSADFIPPELLEGPGGAFIAELLERGRADAPEYEPPRPPPGPVG